LSGQVNGFTIPGFDIGQFGLNIPLSGQVNGFTIPGFDIGQFGLNIPLSGQVGGFTIPGITIDGFPLNVDLNGGLGPISIPINIGGTPGFGNVTTNPSSGFFNNGDGNVSGVANVGSAISGFWNQVPDSLPGIISGYYNVGHLESGMWNLGNTISGLYNTSPFGILTSAFNSGVKNVGQQLAGFFRTGTGP
ncbi:hypothetical protein PJN36_21175, partial [Mycobacterium kansasii]